MRTVFAILAAAILLAAQIPISSIGGNPNLSSGVTGVLPVANGGTGSSVNSVPLTVSTSTPVTVSAAGFYFCDRAGCTYNLPTITSALVGARICVWNDTTRSGAITLQAPASTYIDKGGALGTVAGTLMSGGALDDSACVIAVTTTKYKALPGTGTWTNN